MPGHVMAGVLVTLAFFVLIAYIVRVMTGNEANAGRITGTIIAIGALMAALPAVLYALYGGY